jgi:hypothetical protein
MTAYEFLKAVLNGDLTDKAIKEKWNKLCDALKDQDPSSIKMMISEGILHSIVEFEADDGFGTEGMDL